MPTKLDKLVWFSKCFLSIYSTPELLILNMRTNETQLTSYGPYCGVTPSERDESEKLQYILHWLVFSVSSIWEGNKATET